MSLDWQDIPATTGFQVVYKLVKKAEKIPVPGVQKKALVMAELDKCMASGHKFGAAVKKFSDSDMLDDMVEHVALSNQGIRKLPQILALNQQKGFKNIGAVIDDEKSQ
jgi:hypothetical protein